jgi:hypothetical protein
MNDISTFDAERGGELLSALAEQLGAIGARYELVVIGGSALQALGLVDRPTSDVDVVALTQGTMLVTAKPLPAPLEAAAERVARDFALPRRWINPGPTSLLDFGLPGGFMERVVTRTYGSALIVHFASRFDQIHFKLYAAVDQGPGRHEADLRALEPAPEELLAAARWTREHDPSPGYEQSLRGALVALGVSSADLDA